MRVKIGKNGTHSFPNRPDLASSSPDPTLAARCRPHCCRDAPLRQKPGRLKIFPGPARQPTDARRRRSRFGRPHSTGAHIQTPRRSASGLVWRRTRRLQSLGHEGIGGTLCHLPLAITTRCDSHPRGQCKIGKKPSGVYLCRAASNGLAVIIEAVNLLAGLHLPQPDVAETARVPSGERSSSPTAPCGSSFFSKRHSFSVCFVGRSDRCCSTEGGEGGPRTLSLCDDCPPPGQCKPVVGHGDASTTIAVKAERRTNR